MTNIYCTLFDSHYLSRGLACYYSMLAVSKDFLLYVFAFDDETYRKLRELNEPHLVVVSLRDFEDEALLAVKASRTKGEYCWTCTPSIVLYVLDHFEHDHCTYIDADLFFYRDPSILVSGMKDNSVLITPHYFSPEYDQSVKTGIYCVQFVTFKNDQIGREALRWWREACLDWCYNRFENGKFGDQKYLDDWPSRFKKVFVTNDEGEGVAPWNIQKWKEEEKSKIIFYHFHGLQVFKNYSFHGGYKFPGWSKKEIYIPYVRLIKQIEKDLGHVLKHQSLRVLLRSLRDTLIGKNNSLFHW